MNRKFNNSLECAQQLDQDDSLAFLRNEFEMTVTPNGDEEIYLVGNSLGLLPLAARDYMNAEINKWGRLGVRGHAETDHEPDHPWSTYHEIMNEQMASLVGAKPEEVVVMNGLTVNLHLMMVSFYRPNKQKYKILIEGHAFPTDHFAVESQIRHHGLSPAEALITVEPRPGEELIRTEDIAEQIEKHKEELALILLPGIQYYTGQVFPMSDIVELGHQAGAIVGLDLAHAIGNIPLDLHEWSADFAVWCNYKYMNSGPGAIAGCFVHERHLNRPDINRFEGWWGTNAETRFEMETVFDPIPTVDAWQLSNSSILSMVPIRASLNIFDLAGGILPLREKSEKQINYLDFLLAENLAEEIEVITPKALHERGCQFSLRIIAKGKDGREVFHELEESGVSCDWRYPNVIRVAPVPLYNSFTDIFRFVEILKRIFRSE